MLYYQGNLFEGLNNQERNKIMARYPASQAIEDFIAKTERIYDFDKEQLRNQYKEFDQ